MLKLLLVLGCINLLVFANTDALQSSMKHKKVSLGAKIEAKLAANKTSSFVPLMFVETKFGQVTSEGNVNEYPCPEGYAYLSYNDDINNLLDICVILPGSGDGYRLQAGGAATSPSFVSELSTANNQTYRCDAVQSGLTALDQAICAKTTIVDYKVTQTDNECPEGYDVIINEEVNANKDYICENLIGEWDIVRIGLKGSLAGSGYGCGERDFDDRGMGGTLCVLRQIQDLRVVSLSERDLCGQGRRPITGQEALSNREDICQTLGEWDIVRIAGGGTFDGSGYGCGLREHDRRGVGAILCAPENRAQ